MDNQISLIGVNAEGLEAGSGVIPGTLGVNYISNTLSDYQYWASKRFTMVRLPFIWERVQPTLNGALDTTYLNLIKDNVSYAKACGLKIILDLHNGGGYNGNKIGGGTVTNAHFTDVWTKLVTQFKDDATVYGYDIMNEPNNMPNAAVWPSAAQAAITAIRALDTSKYIIVEGDGYASAFNWTTYNNTLNTLTDSANKLIFSAHSYADRDNTGTHMGLWTDEVAATDLADGGVALTTNVLVKRYTPFVNWCISKGVKGYIGETGVGKQDAGWNTVLDNGLNYLASNNILMTYWQGGQWSNDTGYGIFPTGGIDQAQISILTKYSRNKNWI